jgi:hypothetical protein
MTTLCGHRSASRRSRPRNGFAVPAVGPMSGVDHADGAARMAVQHSDRRPTLRPMTTVSSTGNAGPAYDVSVRSAARCAPGRRRRRDRRDATSSDSSGPAKPPVSIRGNGMYTCLGEMCRPVLTASTVTSRRVVRQESAGRRVQDVVPWAGTSGENQDAGVAISESSTYTARGIAALSLGGDANRSAGTIISPVGRRLRCHRRRRQRTDCWVAWPPMAGTRRRRRRLPEAHTVLSQ